MIGRLLAPILVAAICQIEQDRGRHDRRDFRRGAHLKAAPARAQPIGCAACRIEPVRRAAGKDNRIHLLHQPVGIERIRLPRARSPAHHADAGRYAPFRQDHGNAGAHPRIFRLADRKALDIGNQIARARFDEPPALIRLIQIRHIRLLPVKGHAKERLLGGQLQEEAPRN